MRPELILRRPQSPAWCRKYRRIATRGPKRAHANVWTELGGAAVNRRLLREFEDSRLALWTSSLRQPDGHLHPRTMPTSGLRKRRRSLSAAEKLLRSGQRLTPHAGICPSYCASPADWKEPDRLSRNVTFP